MYYLTVKKNGKIIIKRESFNDYSLAIEYCQRYYTPKYKRSTLEFTTEVVKGRFARSYAYMTRIENEKSNIAGDNYDKTVKLANAFDFDSNYLFIIESDFGIKDAEEFNKS